MSKRRTAMAALGILLAAGLLSMAGCPQQPAPADRQPGLFGASSQTATPFGNPRTATAARPAQLAAPPATDPATPAPSPDTAAPEFKPRPKDSVPAQPLYAYGCGAPPIEVRDPLDPANPYKGQYAGYDVWVYVKAWEAIQPRDVTTPSAPDYANPAGGWYMLSVDDNGWPVPLKVEEELYYRTDEERPACRRAIRAFGVMGMGLEDQQQRDMMAVKARYLPQAPEWLAQRARQTVMILPDGEVISVGPLDQADPAREDFAHYHRYGADGAELGSTSGPYWWLLYWPEFATLDREQPDDFWNESGGYVTRYAPETGETLGTWDYTGKPVKGAPTAKPGSFEWLSPESVRELRSLQTGDPHFSLDAVGA